MINVTKSYLGSKNKFKAYVDRIYNTGWLTNNGPLVSALEQRLKEYLGVRNIILTNNGTIALQIAYRALGITGSAVTTPFSFVATTSSLQWEGIKPIFADIDPATWNLDPAQIEGHIQRDTSAIVATHVFGNPCDVERIEQVAKKHNLKVVYDGAHAFGVQYKGQSVYNWGDISTLSFHATKLFHTIEGGAIVTNDDALAERVRLLCNFGIVDTDQIEGVGINAKLNEFSAAMGMCVLDDIELILECRAEIGRRYEQRLGDHFELQMLQRDSLCNYSYFPIALDDESQLLRCRSQLNENGINPRRYFYPSLDTLEHLQPQAPQPRSRALSRKVLCLPIYPGLPRKVQEKVVQTLIQESVHSTQASRTLFQPFVDAFGLLSGAEHLPSADCKHVPLAPGGQA
ncbi:DegT/DnrJ/EryC1/StrS family aminotransferase [Pseudomonas stutzeri]|uniref:Aminotransferase DegT n=1 Tax=Stutzerimonas stutzeri TaxID=316 RepID=A0A2N8RZ62_STUST|nr:DegT/DnrJ/EryC1/StrS family aminotransferase [Stutzerimonas stutzeri]MCQ4297532.1 DegT/DnrJ/EryC1/StrS family aminotransferase [Stutzerimonas stutzeri]PNF79669.1 aminotransferase DegT [Stutzerimonas stutzeri]